MLLQAETTVEARVADEPDGEVIATVEVIGEEAEGLLAGTVGRTSIRFESLWAAVGVSTRAGTWPRPTASRMTSRRRAQRAPSYARPPGHRAAGAEVPPVLLGRWSSQRMASSALMRPPNRSEPDANARLTLLRNQPRPDRSVRRTAHRF